MNKNKLLTTILTRLADAALSEDDRFVEAIAVLEAGVGAVMQLRLLRDRHGEPGRAMRPRAIGRCLQR